MENKNKNNASINRKEIFLTSFIAGFSGFFIGLLFAPMTGKRFRIMLLEKCREIISRSKFAMVEARVKAEEILEKSREK